MLRFHVHVHVADLERSIAFYSTLFGGKPTVVKPDYAKWMLEDPRVNFAISSRKQPGLGHVGIQAETPEELANIAARLKRAGETTADEIGVNCCYARSDKTWVSDPSGLRWETFFTFGDATSYGENGDGSETSKTATSAARCCAA